MAGLKDWKRRRALGRVAGHLWVSEGIFDFENKEPADYYRVYFMADETEPYARLIAVHGHELEIKLWEGEAFGEQQQRVQSQALAKYPLDIRRKYYELIVRYTGEGEFLFKDWWHPFVFRFKEWVLQSRYQIMTPIRAERLDVLKAVLDKRLNDNDYEYILENDTVNSQQVMVKLFGPRVLNHAEGGRISSRIDLILKSLVESGDIERAGDDSFRPLGRAITTVSQAETDDRRHRDTRRLTLAAIFFAAMAVDWGKIYGWISGWFASPPSP